MGKFDFFSQVLGILPGIMNITTENTQDNFVRCLNIDCVGGFKGVVAVYKGKCGKCGLKQEVVPNAGQERVVNVKEVYHGVYHAMDYLMRIQGALLYDKMPNLEDTELAAEKLGKILLHINPHIPVPDLYANDPDDDGYVTENDTDDENNANNSYYGDYDNTLNTLDLE